MGKYSIDYLETALNKASLLGTPVISLIGTYIFKYSSKYGAECIWYIPDEVTEIDLLSNIDAYRKYSDFVDRHVGKLIIVGGRNIKRLEYLLSYTILNELDITEFKPSNISILSNFMYECKIGECKGIDNITKFFNTAKSRNWFVQAEIQSELRLSIDANTYYSGSLGDRGIGRSIDAPKLSIELYNVDLDSKAGLKNILYGCNIHELIIRATEKSKYKPIMNRDYNVLDSCVKCSHIDRLDISSIQIVDSFETDMQYIDHAIELFISSLIAIELFESTSICTLVINKSDYQLVKDHIDKFKVYPKMSGGTTEAIKSIEYR